MSRIHKQSYHIDEKHTFYMFITFVAAIDQMENINLVAILNLSLYYVLSWTFNNVLLCLKLLYLG